MKGFLNFLDKVGLVLIIIWNIVEYSAVPALFFIIGIFNSFPWQYYAVTIGGYFVLLILFEIIAHFVFKALNKKYTPIIERKFEEYSNRFSGKD